MMLKIILLISILSLNIGCTYLKFWEREKSVDQPISNSNSTSNSENKMEKSPDTTRGVFESFDLFEDIEKKDNSKLELAQAKLWSRIDELEGEVFRQKERLKILEQGLMLGIVPEELKANPSNQAKNSMNLESDIDFALEDTKNTTTPTLKNAFNSQLNEAKKIFDQKRYGKSYLLLSKMEKNYTQVNQLGAIHFWIGKCWFYLEEFRSAQEHFSSVLSKYQDSPVRDTAEIYLARTEVKLGMQTRAINRLQEVIRKNPDGPHRYAAREIISEMEREL